MNKDHLQEILKELRSILESRSHFNAAPIFFDNPTIKEAMLILHWRLSPPAYQWNFWHIIKNDGGIIPFSFEILIEKIEELIKE